MDLDLLEKCSLYLDITGELPHPEFILSLPVNYLDEIALFRQGVRFFEDLKKRPQGME